MEGRQELELVLVHREVEDEEDITLGAVIFKSFIVLMCHFIIMYSRADSLLLA